MQARTTEILFSFSTRIARVMGSYSDRELLMVNVFVKLRKEVLQ